VIARPTLTLTARDRCGALCNDGRDPPDTCLLLRGHSGWHESEGGRTRWSRDADAFGPSTTPDPRFEKRREALCVPLREQAAALFTRYVAAHAATYPDEPPVRAEEIVTRDLGRRAIGSEWGAYLDREVLEDLGAGTPAGSPVDALLRLIVWLEDEHHARITLPALATDGGAP
jgi:hypothetical protein